MNTRPTQKNPTLQSQVNFLRVIVQGQQQTIARVAATPKTRERDIALDVLREVIQSDITRLEIAENQLKGN